MRSEVVYRANRKIEDRYQLCKACAIATRKLHVPSCRIQDTINAVLAGIGEKNKKKVVPILLLTMNVRYRQRVL